MRRSALSQSEGQQRTERVFGQILGAEMRWSVAIADSDVFQRRMNHRREHVEAVAQKRQAAGENVVTQTTTERVERVR